MSIWGSLDVEHEPYIDCVDGTGHYTIDSPESLASTPRGGLFDVATSGLCDLIRVSVQDETMADSAQVWLDFAQAKAMAIEILRRV